jgi:predicted XRE-type DNA-binding protein
MLDKITRFCLNSQPMKTHERPAALIKGLLKAGFSQERIGIWVGLHQSQISKLAKGDSKDMLAEAYMRLYLLAQKNGVIQ